MRNSFSFFVAFFFGCLLIADVNEDLYVTGSLIKKDSLLIANPISSFDKEDIKSRGSLYIENFLSFLPQINPSNSSYHSNKASGTASVSLRGLGGTRTLILLNGKRLSPGMPMSGTSEQDLSQIPMSLIKQVDVLTGGKSTIYGSDAIGGVINFQLDRKFSGIDISYQHSFYNHQNDDTRLRSLHTSNNYNLAPKSVSDGHNDTVQISLGYEIFQNIYLTSYINYRNTEEVNWSQRDISVCALSGNATCRGSSISPEGKFTENALGGSTFHVQNDSFASGATRYNFASKNHLLRPDKKHDFGILLTFENSNKHTFNIDYFSSSYKTIAQLDYSGIFGLSVDLPCNNPFLSNQQFTTICTDNGRGLTDTTPLYISRRNIEGNPRQRSFKNSTDRFMFNVEGELSNEWTYSLDYQNSKTKINFSYLNDISKSKAAQALNVTGTALNPSCVTGNDCKPWNIFTVTDGKIKESASLGVTQEALNYISTELNVDAKLSEDQFRFLSSKSFSLDNKNLQFLDFSIGIEYRKLNLNKIADDFTDGAGQQYPEYNLRGDSRVREIFSELYLPFLSDTNLNFSIRYSDYSLQKNALTYDFGIVQLFEDKYTFKFSHQRAVRMPDISDLYGPSRIAQAFLDVDPCSGANPIKTFNECSLTGVTLAQYGTIPNTRDQINTLISGDVGLKPETATTNSISLNYIDELDLKMDFYSILIKDKIDFLQASFILNSCLESGEAYFCDLIQRNTSTGTFYQGTGKISTPTLNTSRQEIFGLDISINKNISTSFGEIRLSNIFSYLHKNNKKLFPTSVVNNCKGKYENICGLPSPEIQNILSLNFIYKISKFDSSTNLSLRYLDSVKDSNSTNPIDFNSFYYLDMNFSIDLVDDINFSFGINNLLDKNPPLNGKSIDYVPGNANTYPSYYDPLGRFIFLNISKRIN